MGALNSVMSTQVHATSRTLCQPKRRRDRLPFRVIGRDFLVEIFALLRRLSLEGWVPVALALVVGAIGGGPLIGHVVRRP
jgi:hypothetical protein